ncbi:MAG: DNA-binding protein [Bacilli bacterium]|nr:DNA-binding protein [Bacilli bacterium]
MPELCEILDVSINDLFSGEIVDMKNNEKVLEEHLLEMTRLKEEKDRQLLNLEWVIGFTSSITFITLIFIASYLQMQDYIRIILIVIGFITFIFGMINALKIEQVAGYYECSECHHKYVPTYKSVFIAMHMGRTRYLKCPKCNKKSWNKKVLTK